MNQVFELIVRLDVLAAGDPQVRTYLCFPCLVGYITTFSSLFGDVMKNRHAILASVRYSVLL